MSHPHRVKQVNIAKTTQVWSVHVTSTSSQTSKHCKKLHKSVVYMSHPHRVKQVTIAKTTDLCEHVSIRNLLLADIDQLVDLNFSKCKILMKQ